MAAETRPNDNQSPRLQALLEQCQELGDFHRQADADALRLLRWHNVLVIVATIFGYGAVLFAIWQLTGAPWPSAPIVGSLEFAFAVATTIAVLSGLWAAVDHRWRLRRFQAEAAQFARFNFVLNRGSINSNGEHITPDEIVKRLANLRPAGVREWIRGELNVLEFCKAADVAQRWLNEELVELQDYYSQHRLEKQRDYFASGEKWRYHWEHVTKLIAHSCFFVSVIAACAHFWWDEVIKHFFHIELRPVFGEQATDGHALDAISFSLLLLAAFLPVIGAAMRNFRSANEFGRNENRYCALRNHLSQLADKLEAAESSPAKIDCMFQVEEALEYEHRSWQRLMVEAEWFG
ncbi:MAG: hypothetical protein MPJ50_16705 [Pirellulales bacterium]|nr:hypothetical protein [Pirellulales bacterium]